jgi:hypothetical protein
VSDKKIEVLEPEVVEEVEDTEPITGENSILSPEVFRFAQLVSTGIGPTEAYKQTYPDQALRAKNLTVMAYKLAKNPKVREQIGVLQEAVRLQLIAEAPAAFDRVKDLAENAKGEKVKLEANLEILDRAGLKPPSRVETVQIGLWGSLSQEDMRSVVKRRLENQ